MSLYWLGMGTASRDSGPPAQDVRAAIVLDLIWTRSPLTNVGYVLEGSLGTALRDPVVGHRRWGFRRRLGSYAALVLAALSIGLAQRAAPQANGSQPSASSARAASSRSGPKTSTQALTLTDHLRRFGWRFVRDPIADLTLLLFAVALIQLDLSRRTAQRQLRAYIVARPKFVFSFDNVQACKIDSDLRNDGLTPAYDVKYRMAIELLPYPIPQEFYLPEPGGRASNAIILFPRDSFSATYTTVRTFTDQEIADIKAASVAMVI